MSDLILYLHIAFLLIAIVGIMLADTVAFDWVRGSKDVVEERAYFYSHWLVTIGLAGLVFTGCYLFWPMRSYLLTQPYFLIKMVFVFALIINAFFIEALMHRASKQSFRSLGLRGQIPYFLSGAVSILSWVATIGFAVAQFGIEYLLHSLAGVFAI